MDVQIVTADEAALNLNRILASVEAGEEVLIARDRRPVAKLIRIPRSFSAPRPKVGQTISPPFKISDDALAPLSSDELQSWGV